MAVSLLGCYLRHSSIPFHSGGERTLRGLAPVRSFPKDQAFHPSHWDMTHLRLAMSPYRPVALSSFLSPFVSPTRHPRRVLRFFLAGTAQFGCIGCLRGFMCLSLAASSLQPDAISSHLILPQQHTPSSLSRPRPFPAGAVRHRRPVPAVLHRSTPYPWRANLDWARWLLPEHCGTSACGRAAQEGKAGERQHLVGTQACGAEPKTQTNPRFTKARVRACAPIRLGCCASIYEIPTVASSPSAPLEDSLCYALLHRQASPCSAWKSFPLSHIRALSFPSAYQSSPTHLAAQRAALNSFLTLMAWPHELLRGARYRSKQECEAGV